MMITRICVKNVTRLLGHKLMVPTCLSMFSQVRSKHMLPDLPYDYNALEPTISAEIMKLHHSKHHAAYVNNLNLATEKLSEALHKNDTTSVIQQQNIIKFNGGGHINHSIFWKNLSPNGGELAGDLLKEIQASFPSVDAMKARLSAAAVGVQGSGWAWLGYCKNSQKIRIATTANQDPLEPTLGLVPLFGIDVWEHAYYLQYKNVRPDYVKAIWKVVNWKDVAERLEKCIFIGYSNIILLEMANSKYDFHKEEERLTELRFTRGTYIIIRIDGHRFHKFSSEHKFHKPNDKRALDVMIESAKDLMRTYKGHIPLAYGQSDEFNFMIRSESNLLSRRLSKITSLLPVVFSTAYNRNWCKFMKDSTGEVLERKYDAWFDAKPRQYANYRYVIDYFKWRQVDCHINNLYNTTLHALSGAYLGYELERISSNAGNKDNSPSERSSSSRLSESHSSSISSEIDNCNVIMENDVLYRVKRCSLKKRLPSKTYMTTSQATERLNGTVSSDKHEILFKDFVINYNNELEQFKKGTVIVDIESEQKTHSDSIKHFHVDFTKSNSFWKEHSYIFDDYSQLNTDLSSERN